MADNKVIRYIKENLQEGHSVQNIKRYLILHNHSEKFINEAISKVSLDYESNKKD